jgi:Mg2+ and Co2+ transporter CorA
MKMDYIFIKYFRLIIAALASLFSELNDKRNADESMQPWEKRYLLEINDALKRARNKLDEYFERLERFYGY